ncbi:MAG TPA: hypothetical protein VGO13_03890 [Solirubrobacterales bacterium]|jgi:hypothetical protein|nr:hypothetical protein [Solirubrobacterales bacterium]
MKRLRHPIRAIREPFGTAGLIIAMIALIAALGGTALAAAKLNSTQKKEVEKIAKKYAGKPGANGTNGSNGAPGAKGDAGAAGTNGTAGKSVVTSAASGTECTGGVSGTKFEVEGSGSPSHVCSGKNGTPGAAGQPWTVGGTLPASTEPGCPCSEKGAWTVSGPVVEIEAGLDPAVLGSISFPIPLAAAPTPNVMLVGEPAAAGCEGTAAAPIAKPGNLCIFVAHESNIGTLYPVDPALTVAGGFEQAGPTGVALFAQKNSAPGTTTVAAYGTWAVTAE